MSTAEAAPKAIRSTIPEGKSLEPVTKPLTATEEPAPAIAAAPVTP